MKKNPVPAALSKAPPLAEADNHRTDLTPDERKTRMCFAVHEAGHFVVACRLKVYPHDAYVRVPRKSPNPLLRARGHGGSVLACGVSLMQDAAIAVAGELAQNWLPNYHEDICCGDRAVFDAWVKESHVSETDEYAFGDAVLAMVDSEWSVIDAVASCLLHCADAKGYIAPRVADQIINLVERTRAGLDREYAFRPPSDRFWFVWESPPKLRAIREYPCIELMTPQDYQSPFLEAA